MKRQDALRKVRTVCERLDQVNLATFPVVPQTLYLFGSTLTDKPDPTDVDLVLIYGPNPQHYIDPEDAYYILTYTPHLIPANQARVHLRQGMQNVKLFMQTSLATWIDLLLFSTQEGLQPVWKPGLRWTEVIDALEAHPLPWDEERYWAAQEKLSQDLAELSTAEIERCLQQALAAIAAREQALARYQRTDG
ncbi:MAG: hypothetical protein KA765_18080 [Thermoflexales bacterium]|nr:hypothetical protein [Thermoflexales bacterium]